MMGKRYIHHPDMCGCERCALQWDRAYPQPVFDEIDDPDTLDCGCSAWLGCDCLDNDGRYDCDEVAP